MVPRSELVILLASVVISVILGDFLYSLTRNVLVNVVTVLLGTVVFYTILHGFAGFLSRNSRNP